MTIKDLIKGLQKYQNQEARVLITVGNEDYDRLSTSEFELFQDTSDVGYVEIFIDEEKCAEQI